MMRFLHARKFDIDDTRKTIVEHSKWRTESTPVKQTPQITTFLNSGAVYFCGRDSGFRPILVIDVAKFNLDNSQTQKVEFLSKILATLFQFMISQVLIEGQIENYVMIINLNNLGAWSIGGLVKNIIGFTNNTYRSRLFASYILKASGGIEMLWNTIKGILSQNTVKKIKFTSKATMDELFTHTPQEEVEMRFGGTKKDMTSNFWPPECLLAKNFRLLQRSADRLIQVEDYQVKYHQGKLKNRKICQELLQPRPKEPEPPKPPELYTSEIRKQFPSPQKITKNPSEQIRPPSLQQIYSFSPDPTSPLKPPMPSQVFNSSFLPQNSNNIFPNTLNSKIKPPKQQDSQVKKALQQKGLANALKMANSIMQQDIEVAPESQIRIKQIRVIRTFFNSSNYRNMKKNYFDFV